MTKNGNDNDFDIPAQLTGNYIEKKWRELQSDTNMLNKWWTRLEANFHTDQEIKFIESQRRKLEAWRGFSTAKEEAIRAEEGARDAKTDFYVSETQEYQDAIGKKKRVGAKADVLDLETRMAEAEARKAEAEARTRKAKEGEKTEGQKEEKKRPTFDEVREKDAEWTEQKIKDMFSHYETLDEAIRQTYKMEFEKEQGIKAENLDPKLEAEMLYRNSVFYSNLRAKITKMRSRRG